MFKQNFPSKTTWKFFGSCSCVCVWVLLARTGLAIKSPQPMISGYREHRITFQSTQTHNTTSSWLVCVSVYCVWVGVCILVYVKLLWVEALPKLEQPAAFTFVNSKNKFWFVRMFKAVPLSGSRRRTSFQLAGLLSTGFSAFNLFYDHFLLFSAHMFMRGGNFDDRSGSDECKICMPNCKWLLFSLLYSGKVSPIILVT